MDDHFSQRAGYHLETVVLTSRKIFDGENEANESTTLLEHVPLSCDAPMIKAISQDQTEKHHVVSNGTLKGSGYSSSGHWWPRWGSDP